jgi:cbb3-type cytochrome oxidase subunit 3
MNPLTHAAADAAAGGSFAGAATLISILIFAGWTWWALNPANRAAHEAASRLPLVDDDPPGGNP